MSPLLARPRRYVEASVGSRAYAGAVEEATGLVVAVTLLEGESALVLSPTEVGSVILDAIRDAFAGKEANR